MSPLSHLFISPALAAVERGLLGHQAETISWSRTSFLSGLDELNCGTIYVPGAPLAIAMDHRMPHTTITRVDTRSNYDAYEEEMGEPGWEECGSRRSFCFDG